MEIDLDVVKNCVDSIRASCFVLKMQIESEPDNVTQAVDRMMATAEFLEAEYLTPEKTYVPPSPTPPGNGT